MTRKKQPQQQETEEPEKKMKIILHSSCKNELVIRKRDWQPEEIVREKESGSRRELKKKMRNMLCIRSP